MRQSRRDNATGEQAALALVLLALPYFLNDFYMMRSGQLSMAVFWTLDAVVYTLIPLGLLAICARRRMLGATDLGLPVRFTVKRLLIGLAFGTGYYCIMARFLDPILVSLFPPWLFSGYAFPGDEPQRTLLVIYAALSAGILEEIIFRGAAISVLERFLSSKWNVVFCASALFACIHWSSGWSAIIATFLFGLPASLYYQRYRDLAAPIAAHILVDLLYFT